MAVPIPRSSALKPGSEFENVLCAPIVVVAVAFLAFVWARTGTGHLGSYSVTIRLPDAAGLKLGTDVRVAGVKVGSVTGLSLDKDYNAVIRVRVRDDLFLPVDSGVHASSPVVGDVYLAVMPGHAASMIPHGGELKDIHTVPRRPSTGT